MPDQPLMEIDPPDELQIRVILRTPPERRLASMLATQDAILGMWLDRIRRAYPDLSNLELTRLMYERLARNG